MDSADVVASGTAASASPSSGHDQGPRNAHHAAPRETIDLAFKGSQYPTPYSDQSVPGDRPGHRERHLGRDYAPQPLTRSHLNNALVVPHVEGISAPDYGEGSAASVNPAMMYVLNTRNNGKRHFDQGRGTEAPWVPAKRYVPPPGTGAGDEYHGAHRTSHRRGLGIYNLDIGARVHPTAVDALERRRVLGEAAFRGGLGKAMVERPADHSVFQLGLAHTVSGGEVHQRTATQAATSSPEAVHNAPTRSAVGNGAQPSPASPASAAKAEPARYVNNGFVFNSGYVDEANAIGGTPYIGSVRPQQDAPDYLVEREARASWRAAQRTQNTAARVSDDVRAVRQLPDW